MITITWPRNGFASAVVPPAGGMGPGQMCVTGTIQDRRPLVSVVVKVMVFLAPQQPPQQPPGGAQTVMPAGGNWSSTTVPVPAGGWGSGGSYPGLNVGAWEVDPSTGVTVLSMATAQTCGMQANQVDCGSGPLTPCGTGIGIQLASSAGAAVGATAVALAPAVWGVTLGGFFASLGTGLAGAWLLELRDGAGGVWDNGGDGLARPRLELCCDGPPLPLWRLRLRHGPLALEYTAPADWEALGPLTLTADLPDPYPRTLTARPV